MRYTTDPGADTSAQDYLADQGDNGAAKELIEIVNKLHFNIRDHKPDAHTTEALAQLQLYIEQREAAILKEADKMIALKVIAHANPMFNPPEVTLAIEEYANDVRQSLKALSTEEDTGVGAVPHTPKTGDERV